MTNKQKEILKPYIDFKDHCIHRGLPFQISEINLMSKFEVGLLNYFDKQNKNPTLSECIKEWEDRGFEVRVNSIHYLFLINYDKNIKVLFRKFELSYKVEDFYDDEDSCVISYELHNLIHKTLKALEHKS